MRLHHVQVSCPPGGEDAARGFYGKGLGLVEVAKPEPLRARGGVWFRAYDASGAVCAELHLGVEDAFTAARKAHPAFLLDDRAALVATEDRLEALGHVVDRTEMTSFPGYERVHVRDPFGNRVELLISA